MHGKNDIMYIGYYVQMILLVMMISRYLDTISMKCRSHVIEHDVMTVWNMLHVSLMSCIHFIWNIHLTSCSHVIISWCDSYKQIWSWYQRVPKFQMQEQPLEWVRLHGILPACMGCWGCLPPIDMISLKCDVHIFKTFLLSLFSIPKA
jgi:hypothetical protein